MTKRKVISIIGMVLMLYLIGNLFLPFIAEGGKTFSFWEYFDTIEWLEIVIMMIFLLTFGFLTFLCQLCGLIDQSKFVYFPLGFYFNFHLWLFIRALEKENLGDFQVGFWLGLGIALLLVILVFISGFLKNVKKVKRVPIRYDTKTGEPIYE